MNAALRKEVRLLLPAWIVALAASTLPVWAVREDNWFFHYYQDMECALLALFAVGTLLMSLSSFGLEMSLGTFPSLLARPCPRLETWRLKIGLLASALALVVVTAGFSWWLRLHTLWWAGGYLQSFCGGYTQFFTRVWPVMVLLAVTAFAGGLWTTLLLRQTLAAFWFALLVPWLLCGASWPLMERLWDSGNISLVMGFCALAVCGYAAVGYCLARWLFLHAQDTQAQMATDAGTWTFLPAFARPRRPVAALLVKELRLQQGTLLIGIGLVLLHLAAVAACEYHHSLASKYPFLREIWMAWCLMPLLVGLASVAEERRGQTLQSALCLPVGKFLQFVIKLLVVFGLGLFLGAVMPWLLEKLRPSEELVHALITDLGLPNLLTIAGILAAIGCYASSLSGTVLQALGVAIGLSAMWLRVAPAINPRPTFGDRQYLMWPVLIATGFCLSYANFRQLRITWRQWRGNGMVWLAVIYALPILYLIFDTIEYWIWGT